jgi:hypothetical protein
MTIWTVDVGGRPTLTLAKEHRMDAEADLEPEGGLAAELSVLTDKAGAPLWDGVAKLWLREASAGERKAWDEGVAEGILDGKIDSREEAEEEGYAVFLIPVIDPTTEDDE